VKRLFAAVLLLLTLPGCGNIYLTAATDPAVRRLSCPGDGDRVTSTLMLLAQAVPEASVVPCMRSTPPRWRLDDFYARDGIGHFAVTFGDEEDLRITVDLVHRCRLDHVIEAPSDQPGTKRYDHVVSDGPQYVLDRYYVDQHACTALHFSGQGPEAATFARGIVPAIGFIRRATLDKRLRESTDGRVHLDPEPAS